MRFGNPAFRIGAKKSKLASGTGGGYVSRFVSTHGGMNPQGVAANMTTNTRMDQRALQNSPKTKAINLRLVMTGQILNNGETNGPADYTIEGAAEISGVTTRFTKAAANSWPVLLSDFAVISDPIPSLELPATTAWYVRISQVVASLGTPLSRGFSTAIAYKRNSIFSQAASGQVDGMGAMTGTLDSFAMTPIGVIGDVAKGAMTSVAFFGTSIEGGLNDGAANTQGMIGWIDRGLDAASINIPRIGLSRGSNRIDTQRSGGAGRRGLLQYIDVLIMGGWTNDFGTSNRSLAAVKTDVLAEIAAAKVINPELKVYLTTIMPRTTDATNTVPNANGFAGGAVDASANRRNDYNTWLATLSDAGSIDGVIDVCLGRYKIGAAAWVATGGGVEDSANLNFWITSNQSDGVHPNGTGYANAAIPLTALATALGW